MPNFTPRSGEGGWGAARADLTRVEPWVVEWARGAPADLHRLGVPASPRRLVRWCAADRPGVVLGSAQARADVDAAEAAARGIEVVRRVSGGSAVVVGPGRLVWADVVIPRGDPLWDDDIGRAPLWLGRLWAECLGLPASAVHDGPMRRNEWSPMVCFAGVGPGEVLRDNRKVVGISQRRTRDAALFQCAILTRWDPEETVSVLRVPDRNRARRELEALAGGVDTAGLEDTFEKAIRR
ncbi:MAG: hypothetical protein NVSMB12_07050 [Acidimicrobiales bacterium]